MGIGVSVFLIAVGAILAFAVNFTDPAVNLDAVGVILMIVGGIGLLLSLFVWGPWGYYSHRGDRTVVREERRDEPL